MNKVSDKLAKLVASADPTAEVNLHVMLQSGLKDNSAELVVQDLLKLATDETQTKVFRLSGIVTFRGAVASVEKIAENPNVVWIDQDTEAPMEELFDE